MELTTERKMLASYLWCNSSHFQPNSITHSGFYSTWDPSGLFHFFRSNGNLTEAGLFPIMDHFLHGHIAYDRYTFKYICMGPVVISHEPNTCLWVCLSCTLGLCKNIFHQLSHYFFRNVHCNKGEGPYSSMQQCNTH